MRHFTFNLMLLRQRADAALGAELRKRSPDRFAVTLLRRRKRLLSNRLRRSLGAPLLSGA